MPGLTDGEAEGLCKTGLAVVDARVEVVVWAGHISFAVNSLSSLLPIAIDGRPKMALTDL